MDPERNDNESLAALDLALAAELQAALLPRECPQDCPHQVAAARNRMCGSVGGDFHDFLRINEDQVAVVIGDVVGHGVRASLLMAKIMGWLRSEPANRSRPVRVISDLNHMLVELGEKVGSVMLCSMIYMVLDGPTGMGLFVNAGHPHPMLCDPLKCATLNLGARNMLLGIEEFEAIEGCLTFEPGQRLVLYTDGVSEALDADGQAFGERRLHELISRLATDSPGDCADEIFRSVAEFRADAPQKDDETIVVVDRV
jgi:sigma-B regulation protein RsbU (phosphoserine phosphatase)